MSGLGLCVVAVHVKLSSFSYVNPFPHTERMLIFFIGKLGGNMRGHHLSLRASEHLSEHLCFFLRLVWLNWRHSVCVTACWTSTFFIHQISAHKERIFGYLIGKTAGRCFATHDLQSRLRVPMKTFRVVPSFGLTELCDSICGLPASVCLSAFLLVRPTKKMSTCPRFHVASWTYDKLTTSLHIVTSPVDRLWLPAFACLLPSRANNLTSLFFFFIQSCCVTNRFPVIWDQVSRSFF